MKRFRGQFALFLSRSCPLWVKSRHRGISNQCPLYPQKRPKCASNRLCCLCGSRCSQGRAVRLLRGRGMAMKIDRIQPAGMNVRTQQGKPAYSHVVTVTGPGKTIYIAGQLARNAEGNIVGPGDMRAQLEQTFKNLDACLKAAGATWADVVKTNTFVTDYQAFSQCSDVRMRYFGVASPTSTTIQIGGLAQPEAMVEIEMIAVVE